MKSLLARTLAATFVACAIPHAPAAAGDPGFWQIVGPAQRIIGTVAAAAERSAAENRRREALAREQARRAELRRTKAGRAQLAREEREARRRQQAQARAAAALVGALLSGGGSSSSGSGKTQSEIDSEAFYRNQQMRQRNCAYGKGCY